MVFAPQASYAGKRVALVIGNGAYQQTVELPNPRNDAVDMAAALEAVGFEVISGLDLDKAGMDRTIQRFAEALASAELGAFFYAGHGLQVRGVNYLVPVDAGLKNEYALDFEMIRLDVVQRTMENAATTNVIFLDACRDNPLARNLARSMGTRSGAIGRGLAQVDAGVGTLISYATQPGNVALDGTGRNSPYSAALKTHITATGEDLTSILIRVRNDVAEATNRRQIPWDQHALMARLYFSGPSATAPVKPSNSMPVNPNTTRASASSSTAPTTGGRDCVKCPEMIPFRQDTAGLVSSASDPSRDSAETNATAFGKKISIGRQLVTRAEWEACHRSRSCPAADPVEKSTDANHPVTNISWVEATQFATWLSRTTGRHYRLPTSIEHQHAAQAIEVATRGSVRSSGPIFEWTRDCWPADNPLIVFADLMSDGCAFRIVRGTVASGWTNGARSLARMPEIGFRVVRDE